MRAAACLFNRESLISPADVHGMEASNRASFVFGEVQKGDLLACRGKRIIEVHRFWRQSDSTAAQGRPLVATERDTHWRKAASGVVFLPSSDLVAAVAWAPQGGVLRIVLPPRGLGFE